MDKHKKDKKSEAAFIGALITLLGLFLISYNYVESKKIVAYDYMASTFYKEEVTININEEEDTREPIEEEELTGEVTNDYIGYLVIPKINLTKGFLDMRSEDNDVEKNIFIVKGSNYPDKEKGNFIIAGHSGTGWKAFFNDLYKLEINDTIYVNYKSKKYVYKIVNIYKQQKTGTIAIYRDYDKTTLTLITCTNNESDTQTVYISELESIEE